MRVTGPGGALSGDTALLKLAVMSHLEVGGVPEHAAPQPGARAGQEHRVPPRRARRLQQAAVQQPVLRGGAWAQGQGLESPGEHSPGAGVSALTAVQSL